MRYRVCKRWDTPISSRRSTPGMDALATIVWIPQAIGHALDEFDLRVEAFDHAVGETQLR
jgi:hypothetical protein